MYWVLKRNYTETVTGQDSDGNDIIQRDFSHWSIFSKQDKFMLPRGIDGVCIEGLDIKREIASIALDEDDNPYIIENTDLKEVKNKWKEIDKGIEDDAYPVFKTRNRESMLAFVDSFQLRIMAPEKYASSGLLAEFNIGSFSVGDPLDTPEKVKEYYIELLVDLDTKRNQKIIDYLTLKASKGL